MKKRILFIILLLTPLLSQAQEVLDLRRCIEIGLLKNYEIRITRNNQEISDNNLTIGNAGYLPTIDLTGGYSGSVNNTTQKLREGGQNKNNGIHNELLNAGVNLNWTVFDGFNIQANHSKLKELQQMGELNTRLTIENFIGNLTSEYYNYIQQSIRLKNMQSAVRLSKERFRITEARYEIGAGSRLDMQQARVDLNSDSSKLIKQYEILHTSRIALNEMMSLEDINQQTLICDTAITFDRLLDRETIFKTTMESNTFLLLSGKNRNLGLLDLKMAQSENYPYLRLNAGYGYNKNLYDTGSISSQRNLGFTYGVTIGFNIFNGFNRKRKQKNAKIEIMNRELELEQTNLSLKADLSNMWMAYKNNIKLVDLEKQNLETANETYDIAIERYKLGDLSGIELREAQNSLLEAEERLVQAEYSTKLCEISLLQISGQILNYSE